MTEKGHSCWREEQHAKNCFDETTKLQPITIHVRFYGIKWLFVLYQTLSYHNQIFHALKINITIVRSDIRLHIIASQ